MSVKELGHQDYHTSVKDPLDWGIRGNIYIFFIILLQAVVPMISAYLD